jgi:hypothetical protein
MSVSNPYEAASGRAGAGKLDGGVATLAWLAGWLVIGLSVAMQLAVPVNHDAAWVLIGAQRLLEGASFGSGVVDVNPPLAWWISALPAGLAQATGLPTGLVFKLFVMVAALVSVLASARLMQTAGLTQSHSRWIGLASAAAVLTVPGYDFGQREHLMVIMVMPWLWLTAAMLNGARIPARLRVSVAVIAAAGICLKPHFLMVPIAVELLVLIMLRRPLLVMRLENLAMVATGLAYVGAVLTFAPDYMGEVVPAAMHNYDAYNSPAGLVLRNAVIVLGLPLLAGVARLARCPAGSYRGAGMVMLAAALGAALAAFVQMKGWQYHWYPALALSAAGLAVLFSAPRTVRCGQVLAGGLLGLAVVLSLARPPLLLAADTVAHGGTADRVAALAQAIGDAGPATGEPAVVFAFITSPRDVMPAVLMANARWASTACCMHFVPAAVRDERGLTTHGAADREIRARNARHQVAGIVNDLKASRPQLIIFDEARYKLGFGELKYSWLAAAAADAGLARLLQDYRPVGGVADFAIMQRQDTLSLNLKPSLN